MTKKHNIKKTLSHIGIIKFITYHTHIQTKEYLNVPIISLFLHLPPFGKIFDYYDAIDFDTFLFKNNIFKVIFEKNIPTLLFLRS